jgi:hypothetical protein
MSAIVYDASPSEPPANPVLRYLAILSAARQFGVGEQEIERIAGRFDPLAFRPRELADALAETLLKPRRAA